MNRYLQFEYELLRSEIMSTIDKYDRYVRFMITSAITILALGLTTGKSIIILINLPLIFITGNKMSKWNEVMANISGYLVVYLERNLNFINWETRLNEQQTLFKKRNSDNFARKFCKKLCKKLFPEKQKDATLYNPDSNTIFLLIVSECAFLYQYCLSYALVENNLTAIELIVYMLQHIRLAEWIIIIASVFIVIISVIHFCKLKSIFTLKNEAISKWEKYQANFAITDTSK
ncbi:MAG: hypothetical protein R3Y45_09375 [Bacillota bacterium]